MTNLSSMFANVNPGAAAVGAIDKAAGLAKMHAKYKYQSAYREAMMAHQAHHNNLPTKSEEQPVTKPTPMATHPITGEQTPKVPVKPRGKKPTASGTRPKKK